MKLVTYRISFLKLMTLLTLLLKVGDNYSQLVSGNAFLQGNYLEVGIAPCGSFGSSVNAPSGYHPRGSGGLLGFVSDPAQDGWSTGFPDYVGDYFLPGTPEEGWGITMNGSNYNNNLICGTNQITGTFISYSNSGGEVSAVWQGSINGLSISSRTYVPLNSLYFVTEVTITNTSASTVNNLYYMRNVDPDHGVPTPGAGGSFTTQNTIVDQNPNACNKASVSALTTSGSNYLGLGSIDSRARVTLGGFSNRSAYEIWNGLGLSTSGSQTNDIAISIAFNLGNLTPNASTSFAYAYILSSAELNQALAATNINFNLNGINVSSGNTSDICSGTPIPIDLTNTGTYTTWTWSPSTGLNTTTGTSVLATISSPITYTASGSGVCGTVSLTLPLNPVILPVPGNAGTINGPSSYFIGQTGITYSISPVSNATYYNWQLPPGVTVTSPSSTSNSITFNASNSGWCGNISVQPANVCGVGLSSSIFVLGGDNTPPSITCPGAQSLTLSPGCSVTLPDYTTLATFSDNCGGTVSVTQLPAAGTSVSGMGATTVTLTAIDASLNTATCSFVVTKVDNPVVLSLTGNECAPQSVSGTIGCSDACNLRSGNDKQVAVTIPSAGTWVFSLCNSSPGFDSWMYLSNSLCGSSIANNDNSCGPLSQITYTFSGGTYPRTVYIDVEGYTGLSSGLPFTLTVSKTLQPLTISWPLPSQTVSLGNNCEVSLPDYTASATTSGGHGVRTVTQDPAPGTLVTGIGSQTITLTVTDECLATNTSSFTLNRVDNTAPVTPVLTDVTVGECEGTPPSPTTSDNCAGTVTGTTTTSFPITTQGTTVVTWTFSDGNGNSTTATQNVIVDDITAPSFSGCPANAGGLFAVASTCATPYTWTAPVTSDNCSGYSVSWTISGATTDAGSGLLNTHSFNVGVSTVTYTIIDIGGNATNCSFTVTVQDIEAPVFSSCPGNINVTNAPGLCGTLVVYPTPVGTDNCPGATNAQTSGLPSGSLFPVGTTTNTFVVTAANGQSATCSFTVTVLDNENPVITCPGNISVNNDPGVCGATVTYATPVGTDNCPGATTVQTTGLASGSVFPLGSTTNTFVVTDAYNHTAQCSFTVTVTDNEAPTVSCQNITVSLDASGNASITTNDVYSAGNDNCGTVNLVSVVPASFTCANIGQNTVLLTVNDGHGNTATCNATVTVEDNIPPTVSCQNITVQLNTIGNANISTGDVYGTGNDNCGTINLVSVSPTSFTCANIGQNTVLLTVNDGHGNTATCNATVTVEDNVPPVAVCQNITVSLNASGNVSITAAQIDNGSNDACGIQSVSVSPTSFTCANIGANTVTLTVTDIHNNTTTCNATVTVEDNIAPTVSCQNITVSLDANGSASITTMNVYDSGNDNCGTVNLVSVVPSTFTCANIGQNTVLLTVNDGHGNTATCNATVTVEDNMAPNALCQNVTVQLDNNGNASVTTTQVNNGSNDNCGTVNLVSVVPSTFTCANLGSNPVVLTINDGHGNTATCNATVTVQDNIAPTVSCQNITVSLDASGNVSITPNDVYASGNDNCGTINLVSVVPSTFTCANKGNNTVVLTVNDGNGNTATCSATVTVQDNMAPVITCLPDLTINSFPFQCGIPVTFPTPTVTDNCPMCTTPVSISGFTALGTYNGHSYFKSNTNYSWIAAKNDAIARGGHLVSINNAAEQSFIQSNIGAGYVFWTGLNDIATEGSYVWANGDPVTYTAWCPGEPNNQGNEDGIIMFPAAGGCWNDMPTSNSTQYILEFDCINNVIPTQTAGIPSGGFYPVGTTTNTFSITDYSGNVGTCSFTVTIVDATPPVLSGVPANTIVPCDNVPAPATVTASDNCTSNPAVTLNTVNTQDANPANIGHYNYTITHTWSSTDGAGNTATASQVITVQDATPPVLVGVPSNGSASCSNIPVLPTVTATDNCDPSPVVTLNTVSTQDPNPANTGHYNYTITYTWTATDVAGLTTTSIRTLTVSDGTAPILSGVPSGTTASCDNIPAPAAVSATDNCDPAPVVTLNTVSTQNASPSNVGYYNYVLTYSWTATDVAGNSSVATQTITVSDQTPPVLSGVPSPGGNYVASCDAVPAPVTVTATDNCDPAPVVTVSSSSTQDPNPANVGHYNYALTYTWTGTDVAGNSVSGSQTIQISDQTNPVVPVLNDIIAECTTTVPVPATVDNCTPGLISGTTNDPLTYTTQGTYTVNWVFTDVAGNSTFVPQTVIVDDVTAPSFSGCPSNSGILTALNGTCAAPYSWTAPVPSDNCSGYSVSWTISGVTTGAGSGLLSNYSFNVGVSTVTYTIMDVGGNTAVCSFTVTVNDTQVPQITCPNSTTIPAANGQCLVFAQNITPVYSDNCGILKLTYTKVGSTNSVSASTGINSASNTPFNVGTTVVTYTVTDVNNNTSSCSFLVHVIDTQLPSLTCPSNKTAVTEPGLCSATVNSLGITSASDNCGILHITWAVTGATTLNSQATGINNASGNVFNSGVSTVTYTATDVNGNTNTCSFTVTVNDNQNPVITCPVPQPFYTNSPGQCGALINNLSATFTDNCGIQSVTWAKGGATVATSPTTGINDVSGTFFNTGVTTVNYLVTDVNNRTSSCTFQVKVTDSEAPSITCPSPVQVQNDHGFCYSVVSGLTPSYTDNCAVTRLRWAKSGATGGSSPSVGINDVSGTYFNVGVTTVVYTAVDAANNQSTCSFTVTVTDTEAPVVTCPANVTVNAPLGQCAVNVSGLAAAYSDNCNILKVTWEQTGATNAVSPQSGIQNVSNKVFNVGVTVVTYYVTDTHGNTTSCSFTVTVTDNQPPVLSCPGNITTSASSTACGRVLTAIGATASDNCGLTSLTWVASGATNAASPSTGTHNASGTFFNTGLTTVIYTATDINNNTSSCSFTVNVVDNSGPQPVMATLPVMTDQCSITLSPPTAVDNCSGTITATTTQPLTYTAEGNYVVTWTYTDALGNTTTQQQSVIINDLTDPAPDMAVLPVINGICSATATTIPTATDNCAGVIQGVAQGPTTFATNGTHTITWAFDDGNGNVATQQQTVVVNGTVTVTASANTPLCTGVNLNLSASAPLAGSFTWSGPNGYSSTQQNPTISATPASASGNYGVNFVSQVNPGCTGSATVNVSVGSIQLALTPNPTNGTVLNANIAYCNPPYTLYYRKLQSGVNWSVMSVSGQSTVITGLQPATLYVAYVVDASGSTSPIVSATTSGTQSCGAAPVITAVNNCGVINISWTGNYAQYNSYIRQVSPTLGGSNSIYTALNSRTYTVPASLYGSTFEISVFGMCGNQYTPAATPVYVTVPAPTPAAPVLSFPNVTCNSITTTWAAVPGAVNYNVRIKNTVTNTTFVNAFTTNTTYIRTGLASNFTYEIKVIPIGCAGAGTSSQPYNVTTCSGTISKTQSQEVQEATKPLTGDFTLASLAAYPNPNDGNFTVDITNVPQDVEEILLEVSNMLGQVVYTEKVKPENGLSKTAIRLEDSNTKGTYFLRAISDKGVIMTKIIRY
ncbi:MAG: HYR domain-containing protein [Bacteroidia bacterium]|nr:HYR domain-containing protein [Bacteroidia bacterium]